MLFSTIEIVFYGNKMIYQNPIKVKDHLVHIHTYITS